MDNKGSSQSFLKLSHANMLTAAIVRQIFLRMFIGMTVFVNLTSCALDLDDPFGTKARRAEDRRSECQQVYEIKRASYEQIMATFDQEIFYTDTQITQAGHLKQAEIRAETANSLNALQLSDKDLNLLKSHLAASFLNQAEVSRALAFFADTERSIASTDERSEAHQAVIDREDPYDGLEYAIEVYCDGGDMPTAAL